MRFGHWRGVTLAIALAVAVTTASTRSASAIGFDVFKPNPVIPRYAPTIDVETGGPFYAPPIPHGEYAKDYLGCIHGAVGGALGCVKCCLAKLCSHCGGLGCGHCK